MTKKNLQGETALTYLN